MKKMLVISLAIILSGCATLSKNGRKSQEKKEQKQVIEFCGSIPLSGIDTYPHLFKMAFLYGTDKLWQPEAAKCVNEINSVYSQSKSYEEWNTNAKEVVARYTRVWGLLKGVSFNISIATLYREKLETNKDEIIAVLTQGTVYIQEGSGQIENKTVPEFIKHSEQLISDTIVKEAELLNKISAY
jgi:hypothetical protein